MLTIVSRKAAGRLPPMEAGERNVYRAVLVATRAVSVATSRADVVRALDVLDTEAAVSAIRWAAGEAVLAAALPKQYRVAYETGGQRASRALVVARHRRVRKDRGAEVVPNIGLDIAFDAVNVASVAFALDRSALMIREWGATSRAAIRAMVAAAFERGIPPRDLGRQIVDSGIGLTERSAVAVVRRRAKLLDEGGLSVAQVDARVARYARQLLAQRGENIARTEIVTANREGSQASWEQAAADGLIGRGDFRQQWIATQDERLCPICGELDGETARLGEPFPGGLLGPPAHVSCRCALAPLV